MYSRTCLKWHATLLLWLRLNSFKTISSIELIEFIIWVPMYQLKQVFLERSALYWLGTGHLEESGSWPLGRDMFLSHSPQPVLSQSVRASHQQLPSPVLVLLLQAAVLECPFRMQIPGCSPWRYLRLRRQEPVCVSPVGSKWLRCMMFDPGVDAGVAELARRAKGSDERETKGFGERSEPNSFFLERFRRLLPN